MNVLIIDRFFWQYQIVKNIIYNINNFFNNNKKNKLKNYLSFIYNYESCNIKFSK